LDKADRPHKTETILLVEDDQQVLTLLRELLTGAGYHVLTALNGPDALAISVAHPGPIHLLLTDLVMPKMNGYDLALLMADRNPNFHTLFMSGYTEDRLSKTALIADSRLLLKPFSREDLLRKVREVLDQAPPE
jgi:CheY-like chemotaxis protein